METEIITRPGFWNIPSWAIFAVYFFGLIAAGICAWGIKKSVDLWRGGKPLQMDQQKSKRMAFLKNEVFLQKRIWHGGVIGAPRHSFIFWGFVILFFGTVTAVLDWDIGKLIFGKQFLSGSTFYLYKFLLDIAGVACLAGLAFAMYRRYVTAAHRYERSLRFAVIAVSLALIIVTGYLVEALRIAAEHPETAIYSPVGSFIASVFYSGFSHESLVNQHLGMWLFHMAISLTFVALIPFTFYSHIYKSASSIYWQKTKPKGELDKIEDIEEQEEFGISKFTQFSWHDRLNFDACTECGRCTSVCPVNRAGGPLDPRAIILSLQKRMNGNYQEISEELIGSCVSKEALLACTACGACVQQCPSRIEIVSVINQMRRSLGMEQGEFAPNVAKTLQNIQSVGNPWGLDPDSRFDWGKDLDLPFAEEGKHYDILFWVGCSASFDRRNQKIARAMIKILRNSGLSFALMREEMCNAELARRVGEEYLFQLQAQANIDNLRQYHFSRILCICPHCYNTLKNEYHQFERGNFNVVSHVEFIYEQFSAGRFRAAKEEIDQIAIHDPCYLARYNGIVDQSRYVLNKIPGITPVEPKESGCNTTCCGAGGGQFWTDTDAPERLNVIRLKTIKAETDSKHVCTSCPFCLSMMDSARNSDKSLEDIQVEDFAEIVAKHLQ